MKKSIAIQAGFTLIEVLVGMAIITTGLLATLSIMNQGSQNLGYDRYKVTAIQLASNNLESLLNLYPGDPLLAAGTYNLYFDQTGATTTAPGYYLVSWTIAVDNPIPGILYIQETVKWTVTGSPLRTISLNTYRSSQ